MEICRSCGEEIAVKFCSHCGQKAFHRIDKKYLWDEFQYTVLHTNKGLPYSVKNILRNPGKTAREFIDGNRVKHYKPLLLVFVVSGISTFLSFKWLKLNEAMRTVYAAKHMNSPMMEDMMTGLATYSSLLTLAFIPLLAIATFVPFKKWGHNYYEHIIINSYIYTAYTILLCLVIYPVMYFFRHDANIMVQFSTYTFLLVPPILVWFFKGFYTDKPLKSILLKVLASLGLALLMYLLTILIVVIVGIILAMTGSGQQAIQYVKPR
ncbi:MAG: DUF3667 domain-containing protein [Bacteroidetes bacterium]|nr:MAG: DUF3667 domain-containing protein [Bacteroidota bacterium]TAF92330.1 MAG: DUF3667 domain-containing protein [Bacteroidota bacterium]